MNKFLIILLFFGLFNSMACSNRFLNTSKNPDPNELTDLVTMMAGEFSSAEQAEEDTLFYDISLVMYPIWEDDTKAKWLYVEQAVSRMKDKPYRQRVYRVSHSENGLIESKVFELPEPAKYIHAWNDPAIFNQISPDDLKVRQGCAVFLKKTDGNCYSGSTNDKDCKSTLRGASYATSQVEICKGQVLSWDQGWDQNGQQVWGAETRGYVFKKQVKN